MMPLLQLLPFVFHSWLLLSASFPLLYLCVFFFPFRMPSFYSHSFLCHSRYQLSEWSTQVPGMVQPVTEDSWLKECVTSLSNCIHKMIFLHFCAWASLYHTWSHYVWCEQRWNLLRLYLWPAYSGPICRVSFFRGKDPGRWVCLVSPASSILPIIHCLLITTRSLCFSQLTLNMAMSP